MPSEIIDGKLRHTIFLPDGFLHTDNTLVSDGLENQTGKGRLKVVVNVTDPDILVQDSTGGDVVVSGFPNDATIVFTSPLLVTQIFPNVASRIPAGNYLVTASKSGYASQSFSASVNSFVALKLNYELIFSGDISSGFFRGFLKQNGESQIVLDNKSGNFEFIFFSLNSSGIPVEVNGVKPSIAETSDYRVEKLSNSTLTTHVFRIFVKRQINSKIIFTSSDNDVYRLNLFLNFFGATTTSPVTTISANSAILNYSIRLNFQATVYNSSATFGLDGNGVISLPIGNYQYIIDSTLPGGQKNVRFGNISVPGILSY